ncbi:MAG: hypothetical protein AAGF47_03305 [Planctomycetota bacterium]
MTVATRTPPTIELDPDPSDWASMVAAPSRDSRCAEMRRQMGLPTDRPIVMAGHQGQLWHPGIAAKAYAAQALAERIGGVAAWLVVDTDDNDPYEIALPCRDADGSLERRVVSLAKQSARARRAMAEPGTLHTLDELECDPASPVLRTRLESAVATVDAWSSRDYAGSTVTLAALASLPAIAPFRIVRASHIAETDAFRALASALTHDAAREAYNAAVEAEPGSGVRRLGVLGGAAEIPLWHTEAGVWRPATIENPADSLMPKALTLTGLVRAFACDLFIHGTGGRAYEPINDRWMPGITEAALAPFVTASATLRLQFDDEPEVVEQDVARARWAAHHARHHPRLLGDDDAQAERDRLVRTIAALPRDGRERADTFAQLHGLLGAARDRHAGALEKLDADARAAAARYAERAVRNDRTYPAALHNPADLEQLREQIEWAFGGGSAR